MAFPQSDVKTDIYIRPPKVPLNLRIPDLLAFTDHFTNVYKLLKYVYGLKDAGRTWNHHLKYGLIKRDDNNPQSMSACSPRKASSSSSTLTMLITSRPKNSLYFKKFRLSRNIIPSQTRVIFMTILEHGLIETKMARLP